MEHDLDHTYICMQHWHQPKHIIYDITESYIILLNSPYSIFEHLLPQCTAHYQGYRSKTHTHAVWTHRHHERTRFMLRWYELVIAPVHWRSCPGSDSVSLHGAWRVSSHSAADGVSAGRLSLHHDLRKARLIYCGNKEGCSSLLSDSVLIICILNS